LYTRSSTYNDTVNFFFDTKGKNVSTSKNYKDYHTGGSVMVGREFVGDTVDNYRYGVNGQEKDDEIYGEGNAMSAEFWEYDARLGRRWNQDPKPFVAVSSYSCFLNNPVFFTDEKGDIVIVNGSKRFKKNVAIAFGIIDHTKIGHRILTVLHESNNIFTIQKGYKAQFNEQDYYSKDKGNCAETFTIDWDGNFKNIVSLAKLLHELGHGEDSEDGILHKLKSQPWYPPDVADGTVTASTKRGQKGGTLSVESEIKPIDGAEASAMDKENIFRAEIGEKPREYYSEGTFEIYETNTMTKSGVLMDAPLVKYNQVSKNDVGTHPDYNTNYSKVQKATVDKSKKANYERGKKFISN